MATPYDNIYDRFSNLITDRGYANMTVDNVKAIFRRFMKAGAFMDFTECRTDLTDYDDVLNQFNNDLTDQEQELLAYSMLLYYYEQQINESRKLGITVSGTSYRENSHANHIKSLIDARDTTMVLFEKRMRKYGYSQYTGLY